MKKTIFLAVLTALLSASNSFAAIKVISESPQPSNGKDYVGTIVAAIYNNENDQSKVTILTVKDKKNESNLPALHFTIDGNDLPFGMTLASAIGKKIAVYGGANINDQLSNIQLITDEYWNGSLRKKI